MRRHPMAEIHLESDQADIQSGSGVARILHKQAYRMYRMIKHSIIN
jgi:hypothetical protein